MISKQLISDSIPFLQFNDTVDKALNWMETFKISHLPVVIDDKLLGTVSETDLLELNNNSFNEEILQKEIFVIEDQHIFDAINVMADNKLSLLPVLDKKKNYIGSILIKDVIIALKQITSIENIGSIIILEMAHNDYSLTEIANIVESENIKILSVYVSTSKKLQKFQVTLKFNTDEIQAIISSFERYNYKIKAIFSSNKISQDFYNERYDELLHFMNM